MAKEIERKFLPRGEEWKKLAAGKLYRQGYLNRDKACTVRVRTIEDKAFLTVKGPGKIAREEYEYEIPYADGAAMLDRLAEKPLVEKKRYKITWGDLLWEVDEFLGLNAGLTIIELELESEDQPFEKPPWVGAEVTGDPRYFNSNLSRNPYSSWRDKKE